MKKLVAILLLGLCFPLFAHGAQKREIVDINGDKVEIAYDVQRVVPLIRAYEQITAMLGSSKKIITTPHSSETFYKIFPDIDQNIKDASFKLDIKSIIDSQVDAVYGPITQFYGVENVKEMQDAGIVVVDVDTFRTIEGMKRCVDHIAEILGANAKERAEVFKEYLDDTISKTLEITKDQTNKPKVLALNHNGISFTVMNDNNLGSIYIGIAGGENLAHNYNKDSVGLEVAVSTNEVLSWNPDIVITKTKAGKKKIEETGAFANLDAVKNHKVFVVPKGSYQWTGRSGEGVLQIPWLAKIFYPDLFVDIDKEITHFYKTFYYYVLHKEEIETILNQDVDVAPF